MRCRGERAQWRRARWAHAGIVLAALLLAPAAGRAGGCEDARLPAWPAAMVRSELYLGMGRPGGAVTPAEWQRFVREVLAPTLCGYTALDAEGGWAGPAGRVEREPTKLVIVVHPAGEAWDAALAAVARAWRQWFQQEAVLQADLPVTAGERRAR